MNHPLLSAVVLMSSASLALYAGPIPIDFTTFVPASSISAVDPGSGTIAFNYTGTSFIGTEYFDNQLYSTNLSGGAVAKFGAPLGTGTSAGVQSSGSVGEVVVGASLSQGGFTAGDVFAGSGANGDIFHYNAAGTVQSLFATVPSGAIRQIFFDPGSSFGGNMLVTTSTGHIYEITSTGSVSLLASVGEDTEGIDIATAAWGSFAGDLLVSSEGSGTIRLISPGGAVTVVGSAGLFPGAETVSFVPLNLNSSDPLQGFYVANYTQNIQFAAASNFTGLLGDAIVTDETGGSTMWDVHYNGSGFTVTPFTFTGNLISQFEDGIFVTGQREVDTGAPEPATLLLIGPALLGLAAAHRRNRRKAS